MTYFFNGGVEEPYPGEDRILVPSPKVATYDLKPEMSAPEVTDRLVAAIEAGTYDAIVCNYANGDMVGHTGNLDAAKRAVETLDPCIGRVVARRRRGGGRSADHGRPRQRRDDARPRDRAGAHRAHAEPCPVRLCRTARPCVRAGGALQDIAPTMLALMGLPQPPEMTGRSLVDARVNRPGTRARPPRLLRRGNCALAAPPAKNAGPDAAAIAARRAELKAQVDAVRRDIAAAEVTRADAVDALKASDQAISDINRRLYELAQERAAATANLARLDAEGAALERRVRDEQARLARIVAQQKPAARRSR